MLAKAIFLVCLSYAVALPSAVRGEVLILVPNALTFTGMADSVAGAPASQTVQIVSSGADVPVHFSGQAANPIGAYSPAPQPRIRVTLSSDKTPAIATITPEPYVYGQYSVYLLFYTDNVPTYFFAHITVNYTQPPPPVVKTVIDAATLRPGPVSPGQVISVFGDNIAAYQDQTSILKGGFFEFLPTSSGGTQITFDGVKAPIFYCGQGQVNAIVPIAAAGKKTVNMVLTHDFADAPAITLPVIDTSPAIFSLNGQGTGQGAILNTGFQVNSLANPAPLGSSIQIFAEGGGLWMQTTLNGLAGVYLGDGQIENFPPPYTAPIANVSLTIGGQPAQLLYAGQAPQLAAGILQINAIVPPNIAAGVQPVVLTIGANDNSTQNITMVVR